LLFICDAGLRRSPTAAELFADRAETRARGVRAFDIAAANLASREQLQQAEARQLEADDFRWADRIFCMDKRNEVHIRKIFGEMSYEKKISVIGVPDRFVKNDPHLRAGLERMAPYIVGDENPDDMPPFR
jgi:predicted protein tyrosine phosphatase